MDPTAPQTAMQRVQGALARLTEVDARTGCLAHRDDERVLARVPVPPAGLPGLAGEPFTVKDWIDVAGFPCCGGDPAHRGRRPETDATAVARLRSAGGVVVAKTAALVDSPLYGPVRHPHDASLSPGGSSSGDAAAVGGGAVRLGIGSDSGGSVRLPAAWCGIVGVKPSAGLVPTTGHFPRVGDRSDGRTVLGPLASSVDLAWRAVSAMAGPDGRDGAAAPVVLGRPEEVDVTALRICFGSPGGAPVDGEVEEALSLARAALLAAGARDAGAPPDWLDEALRVTQAYWARGRRTGAQAEQDLADWDRFRRRAFDATRDVDVLVTPTVGSTAPPHRAMRTDDYLFCLPASLTGAPAVSVPVGSTAVQVVSHRWADHVAVAVAGLLESAAR